MVSSKDNPLAKSLKSTASYASRSSWDTSTAFEESFRILRSNLSVALADTERPTVIVTSASPEEGKTLTCVNLAFAFAAAGRRTVLVDLDLRHPNAHRLVNAHNEYGVSEVLLGKRKLEDTLQYVELPAQPSGLQTGLYFLGTGADVASPAELLGTGRTSRLLSGLAEQADLVLIDTPPVLPVADTLVIGRIASGALLVTAARSSSTIAVSKAKDLLIRNQTRLFGVVLNKFRASDASYGFGYGYGYGSGGSPEPEAVGSDTPSRNGADSAHIPGTL